MKSRKIGSEMMRFAEKNARLDEFEAIRLDTYIKNTAAIGFYLKLGYVLIGEVRFDRSPLPYPVFEKLL